ncbi:MAG: SidA/IucD/PvdA family monooxygenase [Candidatus Latescibacteria bacterium]|nr:SidA/IucD/PvdA family monooxygenase [Candidatus Latescibacterota bacterium]
MSDEIHDVAVIGAGQAGLAVSYYLKAAQFEHLVLESGVVGESWRSQRWDSFKLNTPRAISGLPGLANDTGPSDGFCTARELIEFFERYVDRFQLPVRSRSTVTRMETDSEGRFVLDLETGTGPRRIEARHVVIATGPQRMPKIPDLSANIPSEIHQLHAAEYRNADALPAGSVLVVGSGQSGCQIAEDLLASGRRVLVSTSKVVRLPRRYRGHDVMEWALDTGLCGSSRP